MAQELKGDGTMSRGRGGKSQWTEATKREIRTYERLAPRKKGREIFSSGAAFSSGQGQFGRMKELGTLGAGNQLTK